MTSREKFEAWWEVNYHNGNPPRFGWEAWRDGDGYKIDDDESELDGMWQAWQAAESASEQKLEESRREFRAADATIHNLELKLTDMAVQLANAESKCRELAAEVQAVRWACGQVYMKGYNHGHLNTVDGIEYASDTELVERGGETLAEFTDPDHFGVAADAILAEVRAQGVDAAIDHLSKKFEGTGHIGVPVMALEWLAQELRKGAAL